MGLCMSSLFNSSLTLQSFSKTGIPNAVVWDRYCYCVGGMWSIAFCTERNMPSILPCIGIKNYVQLFLLRGKSEDLFTEVKA